MAEASKYDFFTPIKEPDETKQIKQDGLGKKAFRYLFQIPQAIATRATWPANLVQQIGVGEALADLNEIQERLPELKKKFPDMNWPESFDAQAYMKGVQGASEFFPTSQNIARGIENKTGLPLEARTKGQKLVNLGATTAAFRPGGLSPKLTSGIVAPTVAYGLEEAGVPGPLAEVAGMIGGGLTPAPNAQAITKPSGLTARGFEKVKKPMKVTPARHEKITEAVEGDFRKITQDLLKDSKTYQALKDDRAFKGKIADLFDKVHDISKDIHTPIPPQALRSAFKKQTKQDYKGISMDEFEKNYFKDVRQIDKQLPLHTFSLEQAIDQFRKNNKSLTELFESGKSRAANRAKTESMLAYNRAIADTIEKQFPDSEINNLFKFSNKRWHEIKDAEAIDGFLDDLFNGKIDYKKGSELFRKERMAEPFKRTMGEKNFKQFETLMGDLLSTEKAMALIKKADSAGFKDLTKAAVHWLVHPTLGKAHTMFKLSKLGLQAVLDKPQYIHTWQSALQNMKKGRFKEASKEFEELNKALLTRTNPEDQKRKQ